MPWSKSTTPSGFLVCDGSAISRSTYAALFDVVGTIYGVGDGSTTFNLPDLQGRLPVGDDNGSTYTIADTGGSVNITPNVNTTGSVTGNLAGDLSAGNLAGSVSGNVNIGNTTLSTAQMPSHQHQIRGVNQNSGNQNQFGYNTTSRSTSRSSVSATAVVSAGGSQAHNHSGNLSANTSITGAPGIGNLSVSIQDTLGVSADAIDTRSPYLALRYVIKF